MRVSIFGFGRVGTALGAALGSKDHEVIGVDVDEKIISKVKRGESPFPEKGLEELMKLYNKNITATHNIPETIKDTDLSFILVPTPSREDGSFDNRYIYEVLGNSVNAMREKKNPHTFVVSSTVSPGSMEEFKTFLEGKGMRYDQDFYLYYNPAFIRQGSIVKDFLLPDVVLVGGEESRKRNLTPLLETLIENDAPFIETSFINSEIAKIALNTFVTLKISFSNLIGGLCEDYSGADADIVMSVIRESGQIVGKKLLRPGLGYGGPCLPRDNNALRAFARFPDERDLSRAVDKVNNSIPLRIVQSIEEIYREGDTIGVLGLSYKPGTYITTESQALKIANLLSDRFGEVNTYDPMARERNCETKEELLSKSDIVLLLTPWEEFSEIPPNQLRDKKVYDAWRFFEKNLGGEENYYPLGVGKR